MTRPSFDRYFMDIAIAISKRGTCDRKQVGCVIVRANRIISTGYNGALEAMPHCDDVGHDLVETLDALGRPAPNCVRTVHAEANAIAQCARFGVEARFATAYTNTYPCWPCFRLLAAATITRIVYDDAYRVDQRVEAAARGLGIRIERLKGEKP